MSRLRCYERRWTGSMAEDGSELRPLEEQLHRLLPAGGELGRGDSQRFCSDFCALVEQHASCWQLPLPQLRILQLALSNFATATGNLPPGCQHVTHTLSSLALSVFELLLFLELEDFHTEPLKQLSATFQDCQRTLSRLQNVFLVQVERVLHSGGPWSSPVLKTILAESPLPHSQVDGCLASEPPVFLELRVHYLLLQQRVAEAMALARCCARHPATGQHLFFLQVYLAWLCRTGQQQTLLREVSLLSGDIAVRIVCNLEAEEDDRLLLGLCTAFLEQQLLRGDLHFLCELVLVWLKLQTRLKAPPDVLLAESRRLLLSASNVNAIFPFMRAILQEVGESGSLGFCVELCLRALQGSSSRSVSTQTLVYKTLALLLRRDLEVCRACALLVFFLERSAAAFATVHRLYSLPDQQYHADLCPVGNRLRFDTLQVLKKDLFFDPEFWNLMALRTSCLKLMSEKAVSAALREIADDKSVAKDLALRRRNTGSKRSRRDSAAAESAPKRRKAQQRIPPAQRPQDAARRSFWQLDRLQRDCDGTHRRNTRLSENQKRRIRTPRWLLEDSGTLDQITIAKNRRRAPSVRTKENGVRNHKAAPVPQLVLELSLPDNEVPGTFPDDARPRGLPQVLLYRPTVKLPETSTGRVTHSKEVVLRARDAAMLVQQLHCYARKRHGKVGAFAHGSASTITRSSTQGSPTKDSPREPAVPKDGRLPQVVLRRRRDTSEKPLTADDCAVEMKVTIASPSPVLEKVHEDESASSPIVEPDGTVGISQISSPRDSSALAPVTETMRNLGNKSPPGMDHEADPAVEESDSEPETEESKLEFRCTFCDKEFRGRRVVEHAMFHYRRDQCMFCGAAFRDDLLAMMHLSDHIERLKRPEEPDAHRVRGNGRRRRLRQTQTKDKTTSLRQQPQIKEQTTIPRQQPQITDQAMLPLQHPQITDQATLPLQQPKITDQGGGQQQPQLKDQVVGQQFQVKDQVEVQQQPQIKDQVVGVEVQQQPQIEDMVEGQQPQKKNQVQEQPQIKDQVKGQPKIKDQIEVHPEIKDQVEEQPQIKDQVEGQPQIKDQVAGQPQIKYQVKGQPQIKDQVEGQPQIKYQVKGQPQIKEQVKGQPQIKDQVEGRPQDKGQVKGTPPIKDQVEVQLQVKGQVEGQPKIKGQLQGQAQAKDHGEGQPHIKDPKIKERLAALRPIGRKNSKGGGVPVVLEMGRSLRSGNKQPTLNDGGTNDSKAHICRESNIDEDGKKTKTRGERVSCSSPGCSWSSEPLATRAAPLYHALEAHGGRTEPLAAIFRAGGGVCPACLRVLRNFEHFQHHAERHRLTPRHPCLHRGCPARFKTAAEMRRHARMHSPLQATCCLPGCPRLFICLWALNLHEKKHFPRDRRVVLLPQRQRNEALDAPKRRGRPPKSNKVAASQATFVSRDQRKAAATMLPHESITKTKNQKLINKLKRSARKRDIQKLATSSNSKQVDKKLATSGNFQKSAGENRVQEEPATCSNLQQPVKGSEVDAKLAPSSNLMQSVEKKHFEEKLAELSNFEKSAKRIQGKEKLATCSGLQPPVALRHVEEQLATSSNFQKSVKRNCVEEKLTSRNLEKFDKKSHTCQRLAASSNLQKIAKKKHIKDKLVLLSNLKQFVEKSHKEKLVSSNFEQSAKRKRIDKQVPSSTLKQLAAAPQHKAPKPAIALKRKVLAASLNEATGRTNKNVSATLTEPVVQPKSNTTGAKETAGPAQQGNSTIARQPLSQQPVEQPRKSQKAKETLPSEATAKRKLPKMTAVTSGKRKWKCETKCETATTGGSRPSRKSKTAQNPGDATEGEVARRGVGHGDGRRLPCDGDSSVCLATLENYRRKPYLRLPPTAYLAERFTAMPRRRRGLGGRAEEGPGLAPEAPTPKPLGPAPRRCATCFRSFQSGEQLQQHVALDGCSAFFGFDD